jgi:hypothetical protein
MADTWIEAGQPLGAEQRRYNQRLFGSMNFHLIVRAK